MTKTTWQVNYKIIDEEWSTKSFGSSLEAFDFAYDWLIETYQSYTGERYIITATFKTTLQCLKYEVAELEERLANLDIACINITTTEKDYEKVANK